MSGRVPEAEADELVAKVDSMIEELDSLIRQRESRRFQHLEGWEAPNRGPWDQDFAYSQLDLFEAIDRLQWFKDDVRNVLGSIRDEQE